MLKERCDHGTVSIGNKMFVIARVDINNSEVFDSITNKFTFIKINPHSIGNGNLNSQISAISVGYKIYVFQVKKLEKIYIVSAFCYDVKQESWISGDNCKTKDFDGFSCAKMFKY